MNSQGLDYVEHRGGDARLVGQRYLDGLDLGRGQGPAGLVHPDAGPVGKLV